jgi:hypothetical protein
MTLRFMKLELMTSLKYILFGRFIVLIGHEFTSLAACRYRQTLVDSI